LLLLLLHLHVVSQCSQVRATSTSLGMARQLVVLHLTTQEVLPSTSLQERKQATHKVRV
jgi:hypothetical protein